MKLGIVELPPIISYISKSLKSGENLEKPYVSGIWQISKLAIS